MIKIAEKPKPSAAARRKARDKPRKGGVVKFIPVTLSLDQSLIGRLDNWANKERKTRSAALRILLSEALK